MKLVTQLRITLLVMLTLGLGNAALTLWNLHQSRIQINRINLVHSVYEAYLTLESHTYQLFKQYGDAIIIGDSNQRHGKTRLINSIAQDTKNIRRLIDSKKELFGELETVELEALENIEQTVKQLISRLDQFSPTGTGELSSDWERLSYLLNAEIDGNFRAIMRSAAADEQQEVNSTIISVEKSIMIQEAVLLVFAILTIGAVLVGVTLLDRKVTLPIRKLVTGVRKFGEGQTEYRVNLIGRDELSEIGKTFDTMAARVASEKNDLQLAVESRTQQLSMMLEDAKRSDESRKRMIADVSHELRTPLTIIKGEADIALRGTGKNADVYRSALERTREAANHTARLVDDLLFVARTETGQAKLHRERVDLLTVISNALKTFGRDVQLCVDLKDASVHADAGRIRQVLLVLLENARHHGGDTIFLKLNETQEGFEIAVEDTGPGMTDEVKAQAFERFYRGSNAAARYKEGVGLGLPVAKSIAKAHGGDIVLDDRPGGGLIARLSLPAQAPMEDVA